MTWSISVSAPNKAAAKLAVTRALGAQMLASSAPHARDFNMVQGAIHGAIDACAEGAISVTGSGYLNGNWINGDIPEVRGVNCTFNVSSIAAVPVAVPESAAQA